MKGGLQGAKGSLTSWFASARQWTIALLAAFILAALARLAHTLRSICAVRLPDVTLVVSTHCSAGWASHPVNGHSTAVGAL